MFVRNIFSQGQNFNEKVPGPSGNNKNVSFDGACSPPSLLYLCAFKAK